MIFSGSLPTQEQPRLRLSNGVFLYFLRPLVMSIINCTPDSFYADSRTFAPEEAAGRALRAEAEGADIVDFGAESTRPGAVPVDTDEEIRRLVPALRVFRQQSTLPVSVDTRKAAVARAALDEGADIINDVSALGDPAMIPLCAERKAAVVLMHGMDGADNAGSAEAVAESAVGTEHFSDGIGCFSGGADNHADSADGYIEEIRGFLLERANKAITGGIGKQSIILDPGFGFNKSTEDNLLLLGRLARLCYPDYPLLVGLSRKRFTGTPTGRGVEERLAATITANTLAVLRGANIIRVHDTAAAVDMVRVVTGVEKYT
jgi:dihydropteroate synthase